MRIDQLNRQHLLAERVAEPLVPLDIAADAIAREQRRPAEQGITGALEESSLGEALNLKTVGGHPVVKMWRLAGADFVTKASAKKAIVEYQSRIGGENQIGQPGLRRHQLYLDAQAH